MTPQLRYIAPLCVVLACPGFAQQLVRPATTPVIPAELQVRSGEKIALKLLHTLSSDVDKAGESLPLAAARDVVIDGHLIIREGAPAEGTLSTASGKARRGPGGRLTLQLKNVELADGSRLRLDSQVKASGGGAGKKTYTGVLIASAVLLSPAGTAFLLLDHGEEVAFPAGTELAATVAADQSFDVTRFPVAPAPTSASGEQGVSAERQDVSLQITTNAKDGSVWVDREFRGEAPLTLKLKPGIHRLRIDRDGYREWNCRVVVDGEALDLLVTLRP